MNRCHYIGSALGIALLAIALVSYQSLAQTEPKDTRAQQEASPDLEKILQKAKGFVDAYNSHDAKAVAALYAHDAEAVDRDGEITRGKENIEQELDEIFKANPKGSISLEVDSLRQVTPEVALEKGRTTFFSDGKTPSSESLYEVVHVKQRGEWLMSQTRIIDREIISAYEPLQDLEWMIGDWVDEGEDSVIETSCRWAENRSFLLQDFTVRIKGKPAIKGTQRIGYDPLSKQLRSWVFDTEGGYAEGLWSKIGEGWIVKAKGVRNDGTVVTATNEYRQVAEGQILFRSVDRIAGDERMPDIQSNMVRRPPAPKG